MHSLMKYHEANTCEAITLANETDHFWYPEALLCPSLITTLPLLPKLNYYFILLHFLLFKIL